MSDLYAVAGAKFYIGSSAMVAPSVDVAAADFSAVTFIEVIDWQSMGAIGDQANEIATELISRGRTTVQKGTYRSPSMQNVFAVNSNDPGQIAIIAAANNRSNYPFKIAFADAPGQRLNVVTVTIASPGVFTWTGHSLEVGDAVHFTTTGALPTGLTAGTTYYVKTTPDANTFTVAATAGGTAIVTTGTQSGVHTATTQPTGTQKLFVGLAMSAQEQGGGANTARMLAATVAPNSNIVTVLPTGVA